MAWVCVLCGQPAIAEIEAAVGLDLPVCEAHLHQRTERTLERIASLERVLTRRASRWCSVPDCTVPADDELCEAHRPHLVRS